MPEQKPSHECECSCHSNPDIVYHWPMERSLVLCCQKCPGCGKNIAADNWEEHEETCGPVRPAA